METIEHVSRPLLFLFLSQLTACSFKGKWIMLAIPDGLQAAAVGGGFPMCPGTLWRSLIHTIYCNAMTSL